MLQEFQVNENILDQISFWIGRIAEKPLDHLREILR
jgi:hypothetical protein